MSLLTIYVQNNWNIGLTQLFGIIFTLGVSVNQIVHLVVEYVESQHRHRKHKMKQSIKNIGTTILNGAVV